LFYFRGPWIRILIPRLDTKLKGLFERQLSYYLEWMNKVWKCQNEPLWLMAPENVKDGELGNASNNEQRIDQCHVNQQSFIGVQRNRYMYNVYVHNLWKYLVNEFRLSRLSPTKTRIVRKLPMMPNIPTLRRPTPLIQKSTAINNPLSVPSSS
jgi:hypothetical protein